MQVGVDGTPLLGARTGIGRYVHELLAAWPAEGPQAVVTAFTTRGGRALATTVPEGVATRWRPLPARLLHRMWQRVDVPTARLSVGPVDVFHGTNFVLPPPGGAAGVVTVHDLSYLRTPETVSLASGRYRQLVPASLRRASVVCTPTRAVAEELAAEYAFDADRIVVTPLGVAPAWFETTAPDPAWLADRGVPPRYFLLVGALEPRKGVRTGLVAHRAARAAQPDLPPLVHVGPPGWGPGLTEEDAVGLIRLGYRSDQELRALVAGAIALVFPSLYEGFGLPPLEALASGTTVLSSDLPAVREVTGGQAELLPPHDPDAWATALLAAARNGPDPAVAAARRAHAAAFTWKACAHRTLAAYDLALAAL